MKLLVATFQNLFPPIQVQSMKLSQARRIVLLNYNSATGTIDWRHYLISVRPVGVSKSVRRVVEGSSRSTATRNRGKLPDLSSTQDISDYVLGRTAGEFETDASEAESDAEDDPRTKIHLHDRYVGRGNAANTQKAVKLREIGPRMELKLVKIEEGCNEGAVLFHEYIKKTAREEVALAREHVEKRKLQEQRRAEQEENVERKKQQKAELRRISRRNAGLVSEDEADISDDEQQEPEEQDDEFAYEDQFGTAAPADEEELFDDHTASEDQVEQDEEEESEEGEVWNPKRSATGGWENPPGVDPHSDESDLDPIPLGTMQHDYTSAEEWPEYSDDDQDDQPPPPASKNKAVGKSANRKKSRR